MSWLGLQCIPSWISGRDIINDQDVFKTAFKTHTGQCTCFFSRVDELCFQAFAQKVCLSFLLVFFDDILIYSKIFDDHLLHLEAVFELMVGHGMYAKESKCIFGSAKVEYLGHFISSKGVETDPQKVSAVSSWPHLQ